MSTSTRMQSRTITEHDSAPIGPRLSLIGITYRDLDTCLDSVAGLGDGKRSTEMAVGFGGFPLNAARAAVAALPAGSVHVVTVVPWAEFPALSRAMPDEVVFDAILAGHDPSLRLPNSLVFSDAAQDRRTILKGHHTMHDWLSPAFIPQGALQAPVVAVGRIPETPARELQRHCLRLGTWFAWCGGSSLPLELEADCQVLLVDRDEAVELLGLERPHSTSDMALALATRAQVRSAVRVVTGGGSEPTAVVLDAGNRWDCLEGDQVTVDDPKHPKGAGDTFAARFLATVFSDPSAPLHPAELARALQHARFAAAAYVATGQHATPGEVEAAIASRGDYRGIGKRAIRLWSVPKPLSRVSVGPVWECLSRP